jgi:hypothetical protein
LRGRRGRAGSFGRADAGIEVIRDHQSGTDPGNPDRTPERRSAGGTDQECMARASGAIPSSGPAPKGGVKRLTYLKARASGRCPSLRDFRLSLRCGRAATQCQAADIPERPARGKARAKTKGAKRTARALQTNERHEGCRVAPIRHASLQA